MSGFKFSSVARSQRRGMKRARVTGVSFAAKKRALSSFGRRRARKNKIFPDELKFLDSSLGLTALTSPTDSTGGERDPAALCLNAVPQNDTMSGRDGSKIIMKSIQLNGVVRTGSQTAQTAADNGVDIFVALVLDTQTNSAQLNSEDVFTNPLANAVLATHPLRNMSFTSRFKVLKTEVFKFGYPTMVRSNTLATDPIQHTQAGEIQPFSWYVKLPDIQTQWATGNTDGAITAITSNTLHVIAFCNNTDTAPNIAYNARLRFLG